jgi:diaminopimelate decarboxylase
MFNRQVILEQAKKYDSFYLYDESKILEYTGRLKADFEGVGFLYSIKTNPNPMLLKTVFSQGFGADAASLGEVMLGKKYGLSKQQIYYSTPGKSRRDISEAMDISVIIADSIGEILKIQELAQEKGIVAEIGVRLNPDFTFYTNAGLPSKFGMDERTFFENALLLKGLKNIKIIGIHVHSRSQELDAEVLKKYYENMFALANSVQEELNIALQFINLGSGIGIPYSLQDKPLDTKLLGRAVSELIAAFKGKFPHTAIFIETGRFAVGKSGVYVTKVLDKKTSYGKTFVILSNTLNGFVRPSLAQLVINYSQDEEPAGSEPLFTSVDAFEFIALTDECEQEVVTLVGNLCTSTDIIAKDILMPKLAFDDVIVITNAGSYAAVISPMQFASLVPPAQLFLSKEGAVTDTAFSEN